MSKVEIRLPFVQYDNPGKLCDEVSMTRQEFSEECDFNTVMHKWQVSGLITHVNTQQPQYLDLSEAIDFQESLAIVQRAQAMFASLPSHVRDRFGNNPQSLLDFLSNPENIDEAVKLGLAKISSTGAERPPESGVAPVGDNLKSGAGTPAPLDKASAEASKAV